MKNKMINKSLNSPVKHSKITPLSLMHSANSLLKFKLYEHLIVITTLACGQRGAVQVCAMETGDAEADTSRWVTTRLSQNQNPARTVEGVSLFHPSETSRQSQIPALSGDVSVVKYDKKKNLDHDLGRILNVLQEFGFWLRKSQVTELKHIIRECWYIPAVVQNCSFSTLGWGSVRTQRNPQQQLADDHVWLDEDEPGWWITATGL